MIITCIHKQTGDLTFLSFQKSDKLLARRRWRKGISLNLSHRTPNSQSKTVTGPQQREIFPEIKPEHCVTPVSSMAIPPTYSKDHDENIFSYDPYGVLLTKGHEPPQEPTVENWIVSSPPPERCSDVLKEECTAKMLQLEEVPRDCESESIFDCETETESNDSAFIGSEGQYLKSSSGNSNVLDSNVVDSSYPVHTHVTPLKEPIPDYSSSVSDDEKNHGEIDNEISKVLSDFEGDLNDYYNGPLTPTPRRFVTIRSIIYI